MANEKLVTRMSSPEDDTGEKKCRPDMLSVTDLSDKSEGGRRLSGYRQHQ
jgi:hypothetical protein